MAAATTTASSEESAAQAPLLTILHFNDVYEIQPRAEEPVGGASRLRSFFFTRLHGVRCELLNHVDPSPWEFYHGCEWIERETPQFIRYS